MNAKFLRKNRILWFLSGGVLFLGILILAAMLSAPPLIEWYIKKELKNQGASKVGIQNLDVMIFTGELSLDGFHLTGKDEKAITLEKLDINISLPDLFRKRIIFEQLKLHNATMEIARSEDNNWVIGGLPLEEKNGRKSGDDSDWNIGIENLRISDVFVQYNDKDISKDVTIRTVRLDSLKSWTPTSPSPFFLDISIDSGTAVIQGKTLPFQKQPEIQGTLSLKEIPLAWLEPLLFKQNIDQLEGTGNAKLLYAGGFDPNSNVLSCSISGSLQTDQLKLHIRQKDIRLSSSHLAWKGDVAFALGGSGKRGLHHAGKMTVDSLSLDAPKSSLSVDSMALSGTVSSGNTGAISPMVNKAVQENQNSTSTNVDATKTALPASPAPGKNQTRENKPLSTSKLPEGVNTLFRLTHGKVRGRNITVGFSSNNATISLPEATWNGAVHQEKAAEQNQDIWKENGAIIIPELNVNHAAVNAAVKNIRVQTDTNVFKNKEKDLQFAVTGKLNTSAFSLTDPSTKRELVTAGTIRAGSITVTPDTISAPRISFENPDLFERNPQSFRFKEFSHLASMKRIVVYDTDYSFPSRLTMGRIRLSKPNALLLKTGDGLEATSLLPNAEERSGEKNKSASGFELIIGQVNISNGSMVFADTSITPDVQLDLTGINGRIKTLEPAQPQKDSFFEVKSTVDGYAGLEASGTIHPFQQPIPPLDVKGKITQLNLLKLSPYIRRQTGYKVQNGLMNINAEISLAGDGEINGSYDLFLSKLDLKRLTEKEKDEFTQEVGMPLGMALNLLKNDEDAIEMTIPVSGNVNEMKYGAGGALMIVVEKAFYKAVKTAVISYFAPVGAVFALEKIYDFLTTLRFDPVLFKPGESALTVKAVNNLEQLAQLLKDKEGVRIVVCGKSTTQDIPLLQNWLARQRKSETGPAELSTTAQTTSNATTAVVDDPWRRLQLLEMAKERSKNVKDYLVNNHEIDPSRIILCAPEIDTSEDGQPRVDISI